MGTTRVYDLEVATDHSFLADGIFVHNSKVNLQNLPSTGSTYSKDVKECFSAPIGWLLLGADFDSLEDKISALTTKDKNKLKVYIDGYCGHCLRAYSYFKEKMVDIVDIVKSINSIENSYPELRQKSKGPTFLLTYGGTYIGLMGLGFSEEEAKSIEKKYHELYAESDAWVQAKLEQASKDGYATLAFGLRLRTPILAQTLLNAARVPSAAKAEGRTVGNALGQSWGMLNNRAAIEFYNRLMVSPYAYDIKPISHIHDAQYFLVKNEPEVVTWFNKHLTECMAWQDLDEIKHDEVKLSGGVELFYPTWANAHKIPTDASLDKVTEILNEIVNK